MKNFPSPFFPSIFWVSGAFIGRLFPNQSYEMTAQHSDFHHAQEQVKTYVRLILDVCEEEKERDEGKVKSVCTNVLDKLWDSIFFPLVGVDDDDEDDEEKEEENDAIMIGDEEEDIKKANKNNSHNNNSTGENTREEEMKNVLYSRILDEVLQDTNLNTSRKTRKDLKQNNHASFYSEEFEKPNFTLEDSYDLLISWLVQEWEYRFKNNAEDSAKEHAERHFARIEYLVDRIRRREEEENEGDDEKEMKASITRRKEDRRKEMRNVAEKEDCEEEQEEECDEERKEEVEDGEEAERGAKESKFLEFHQHSPGQTQKIFHNRIYEAYWAKTRSIDVKPEDFLESGKDPAFTKLFRKQGAMVLKLHDSGWDKNTNASTFLNLDWIRNTRVKLQTLGPDYQYIRQTLPDPETGILRKYQDMDGYDPARAEFGALVEEIQENFKFAAQPLRLMGVVERERFFITQIRNKLPAQYPYLQGVAVVAMDGGEKKALSGLPSQNPWNIFDFAERPTSVTRQLLKICEAACSPHARQIAEEKLASEKENKINRFKTRQEDEMVKTGAKAVEGDPEARKRRNQRKRLLSGEKEKTGGGKRKAGKSGGGSKKVSIGSISAPMVGKSLSYSSQEDQMNDAGKLALDHVQEKFFEASCEASRKKKWGAGIVNPWLYYMSPFSFFPMHFEDYALGSANVIVADPSTQCWVVWYSISSEQIGLLHEFLKDTLKSKYQIDCLESRELWINPEIIANWNAKRLGSNRKLKVYRHVQGPGEYVVTDYGSVHWGVNLGVGWKAAVNFAYLDWKAAAQKVDLEYRKIEMKEHPKKRHYRCAPKFGLQNERLFSMENILGKDRNFPNNWQKEHKKGLQGQQEGES